jgi:hypothetical protein
MARQTPVLIVVALIVFGAGAAAAQSMLSGGSPGLAVSGSTVAQSSTPGSTPSPTPTPSTSGTTATPTPGPSTGVSTTPATPTTPAPSTAGTTAAGATATSGLTVDEIISLTRTVDAGVPAVGAFTVPAGRLLVVTDVLITNTGTAPACGAAISPGATTSAPTSESGTGVLCIPPQTSLNLGLTTGLEFGAGQTVVLANAPTTGATAGGALHYHLRGFLATASGA